MGACKRLAGNQNRNRKVFCRTIGKILAGQSEKMQLLDLKGQCVAYKKEIDNVVSGMVESGVFIGGEKDSRI